MTEVKDLFFSYGRKSILNGLSFSVDRGECLVFAGPNGSGKSTVLSLVAGVLRPKSGTIITASHVGLVPQGTGLFEDLSAEDNLRFFAKLAKCKVPDKLPFALDRYRKIKVSKMSGGMKKQLSIACALLGEPQLILLDEPCAALDIEYREELTALINDLKSQGCSIIYVGHEPMEFAPFYDSIIFLGAKPAQYTRAQLSGNPADDALFLKNFSEVFKSLNGDKN